jgi:hypothetical protein
MHNNSEKWRGSSFFRDSRGNELVGVIETPQQQKSEEEHHQMNTIRFYEKQYFLKIITPRTTHTENMQQECVTIWMEKKV